MESLIGTVSQAVKEEVRPNDIDLIRKQNKRLSDTVVACGRKTLQAIV